MKNMRIGVHIALQNIQMMGAPALIDGIVAADRDGLDTALRYYRTVRPGQVPAPLRGKIKVDAMVFAGLDDPGFPVSDYERARYKFEAGYEVVALPGGHFVHRESSDAFIEHLLRFVGTAEPRTAGAAEQADTD